MHNTGKDKLSCPFVSVIIPVYNDPERLKTCLQALEDQTYPKNAYEVIVVDNGSDESIEPIVAEFSQTKASYETLSGSYAARNKGISISRGEVLAFTDADCIPAADWIEKGVTHLLDTPTHEIVGGKVDLFFEDPDWPTAAELYDRMMNFDMKMYIEKANFSATANLFTFKRVFEQVGCFERSLKSGGDLEWGQRAASLGYKLRYADDVRVAHPARSSLAAMLAKERRVAKGLAVVGRNLRRHGLPLRWRYDSIMEHLPPLPPVIKIMRLKRASLRTKMMIIVLWFVVKSIRIEESVRMKLSTGIVMLIIRYLKKKVHVLKFRRQNRNKEKYTCPICNYRGPFEDVNPETGSRKHAKCPNCDALERHRLQFLVLQTLLKDLDVSQKRILHFAPEPFLRNFFAKQFGTYETADLRMEDVDHNVDIQELPFADKTYDFVYASHVLEHIPDDKKALQEIRRILKPGGIAILPVPVVCEKTVEYSEPNPHESYHVRAPGYDYFDRYAPYFSTIEQYASDSFPEEYQVFEYEDRTKFPSAQCPLRPAMAGEKQLDIIPVCYV